MEDGCPFCGMKKVQTMTFLSGVHELYDCHNIFVNGELFDKRQITCYETELAQLKADLATVTAEREELAGLLRDMGGLIQWIAEYGDFCDFKSDSNVKRANEILNRPKVKKIMGGE